MKRIQKIAAIVSCFVVASPAVADWGTLRGRFVVDGSLPKLAPIVPEKDAFCEHAQPVNESVVVGEAGGLANVVVYLRVRRGESVAVHPDYATSAEEPLAITNRGCRFEPRITLLRTGQPLVVKNADPTAHNTKFDLIKNDAVNSVIPADQEFTTAFNAAESKPLPVSCNIHPFMRGYVLVRDDPYMAVTGEDGLFEIQNLPAGEHQFQFWHESGYLKDVAFGPVSAEPLATDRRGRVRLTISAGGQLDLGTIRIPAGQLAE
ncbi:MAG: hypothetical protein AAGF31_10475 [Planctomycetota bacterium]